MAKLSKRDMDAHNKANDLVNSDRKLTEDERIFIIENWHESANHMNAQHGAFFTPWNMAYHVGIFTPTPAKVLDLCCGIGALSLGVNIHNYNGGNDFVMLELNPDYAKVAKRVMPQAEVIVGSVYDPDVISDLKSRGFDVVISNPPFGTIGKPQGASGPRYTGGMQHEVIDIASDLARYGIFILGAGDVPFEFSGKQNHKVITSSKLTKFYDTTGIKLHCMSVDTSGLGNFKTTSIKVEMADCDFENEVWPKRF